MFSDCKMKTKKYNVKPQAIFKISKKKRVLRD